MIDLIPVLDHKQTISSDKMRALIIFIIAHDGIQDDERRRLLEAAKISSEESQAINNLSLFNVELLAGHAPAKYRTENDRYTYWGSHKVARRKAQSKRDNDNLPYDLSRYIPLMKRVVEDQADNSLPKTLFPWVKDPSADQLGISTSFIPKMFQFSAATNGLVAPDPNYPTSLRTTRVTSWAPRSQKLAAATKPGAKKETNSKEDNDFRRNGSRIILFSIGGLTYSEVRSAYEISKDQQREIFFGSIFI